jgi:WD40 repeat protein
LAPTVVTGGGPARGAYDTGGTIFSGTDDTDRGRVIRRLTDDQEAWRTDVNGAVTWLAATDRRVVALVAPAAEPVRFIVLDAESGDVLFDESLNATRAAGAVSPDGSMAVLATRDAYGSSFVEVDLGILAISEPTDVSERVTAVAISPDGSSVVTGHATGDIAVRGLESFTAEHRTMPRVDDSIEAVGFTPDGETVVAGGSAGVVHVLDATTLEPRFSALEGHRRGISSVASNDDFVLAASADGTVRIWDLAGGGALGGPIHTGGITAPSIAMNSNGDRALVQGDRGLLELVVDEGEWVRLACSIAGGELTEDERASYGLGRSTNPCGPG